MPQIRVTNNTKKVLDEELALQKDMARELGEPLPAMAYVIETLVLEGLISRKKARERIEKKLKEGEQ